MSNALYDALFEKHRGNTDIFLQFSDGSSLTYADFIHTADRYANALLALGIQSGDRIAVQVAKSPEALAVYAASTQAGIIFLPLNTAYTAHEVSYFVENSEAKLLLCDAKDLADLTPIASVVDAQIETLNSDGSGSFPDKARDMPTRFSTVARAPDDIAAFLYTSGTTGRSKGTMLTHTNLLSNAQVLAEAWAFTSDDVLLHALPIFHTHGLFVGTNITLLTGGKMVFLPKFDTDAVIDAVPKSTSMMGVPTFYTRLLDDPRLTRALAKNMRLFISGSAPLLAETHTQFEARTGHRILERYGMTETNMNTSNPYVGDRKAGTVGTPLPGTEVKITDAQGAELPQGEIGMVEVRGPNVFRGYWKMPEKTAEELRENGFFVTGDLGRFDEDGYLHIVGRDKDLIISGGYNIYPKEIELVLDEQTDVRESAVIGIPHPDFGETPVGILVAQGAELDLESIRNTLSASLARFKQPQRLIVVDELPRNTMGKVQKSELRKEFADLFQK